MDHGVEGGHLEGVPSDEEGLKGEDLPGLGVLEVAGDHAEKGPHRVQAEEVRGHLEEVQEASEVGEAEFQKALLEEGLGVGLKAAVALEVLRGEAGDLALQVLGVVLVVKVGAVREVEAVEGVQGDEPHVALRVLKPFLLGEVGVEPGVAWSGGEEVLQEGGDGDHRGPHVKGEALRPVDEGPASGPRELFQDQDLKAHGGEADGRGEPSYPASDDDGPHGEESTRPLPR